MQDICRHFLGAYFDEGSSEFTATVIDQIGRLARQVYDNVYEKHVLQSANKMLFGYVFPDAVDHKGMPKALARCKTDEQYLRRRAEDLSLLPLYNMVSLSVGYTNATASRDDFPRAHAVYEVGLPAYRIGAAVLSDLASMMGSDLPPAFWLSYWPSHISLAEHAKSTDYSDGQNELIMQTAEQINDSGWTYYPLHGIIKTILEQGG